MTNPYAPRDPNDLSWQRFKVVNVDELGEPSRNYYLEGVSHKGVYLVVLKVPRDGSPKFAMADYLSGGGVLELAGKAGSSLTIFSTSDDLTTYLAAKYSKTPVPEPVPEPVHPTLAAWELAPDTPDYCFIHTYGLPTIYIRRSRAKELIATLSPEDLL